jgi:radical SAM superfamily enzyme YgiQ (UPF0313 family)
VAVKIILIYPRCISPRVHWEDVQVVPMGLYTIGAVLMEAGHEVAIWNGYELNERPGGIEAALGRERPQVVGISIVNANRQEGVEAAAMAKRLDPATVTVLGGVGATFLWRHLLTHFKAVDFVVRGEGEVALQALIRSLEAEQSQDLSSIKGLAFRHQGDIYDSGEADALSPLDSLPDPARYFTFQHIALSRGCPENCAFCGSPRFWHRRVRFHSADYFVAQIRRLHERGVRFFYISDDTFTLRRSLTLAVCRKLSDMALDITWNAICRVDSVDAELLYWMRRAGCIQISYGVESGSAEILRHLNKRMDHDQAAEAFRLTVAHGIMARAYFIYGSPGETWETIAETVNLMDRLKPLAAIFYMLDIFPGTQLCDDYCQRSGLDDEIWLEPLEGIAYCETDPELDHDIVTAFGAHLRKIFYRHLADYVEAIDLVDVPELKAPQADFLSRLAMTFDHGDYARIDDIDRKDACAELLYRRSLQCHDNPRAYLGLGIARQKVGDYPDSIRILTQGVAKFPGEAQLAVCLAVSLMNVGDYAAALDRLNRFAEDPTAADLIAKCQRVM